MRPGNIRTSWGLIGIQERASLINAELTLQSVSGSGTTFTVRLREPPAMEVHDDYKSPDH
jgi:signal transduction histidine kinase